MTMTMRLPGGVDDAAANRDTLIQALEDRNRQLSSDLRAAQAEIDGLRTANARAVSRLRQVLSPLYRGLQEVFGEIDAIGPASTQGADEQRVPDRVRAAWESWKQKLPGKRADFIQALLEHGALTAAQLRVTTRTANGTVPGVIHELKKLGLIDKNGSKYSLKEL